MLNETETFVVKDDIVFRTEDEGAFLFEPDTGRICYLNDPGIIIWKLCKTPVTQEQIIDRLCLEYPQTSPEQISEDCLKFINDLMEMGLLATETKE